MRLRDRSKNPSPLVGEGGARRAAVGGRGGAALANAKAMRKAPTEAERKLWSILRGKRLAGFKFKRQQPIGRYIVDFASLTHRLIVETDGSQHLDSAHDAQRDAFLRGEGFRIVRVWNSDALNNPEGVAEAIFAALGAAPSPISPSQQADKAQYPLPQGERNEST